MSPTEDPPKTFTQEDLDKAKKEGMENARKEERDKFSSVETRLKDKIDTLDQQVADTREIGDSRSTEKEALETKLKETEELLATVRAKTKEGAEVDIGALVKEVTEKIATESKAAIKEIKDEAEARVTRLEGDVSNLRVENLKTQLIADADGQIIASLVTGETEEEVRASVEHAKKTWNDVAAQVKGEAPAPTTPTPAKPPGTEKGHPVVDTKADEALKKVNAMSQEEYEKLPADERKKLRLAVAHAYEGGT